jgi:hypothetical protein
MPFKIETRSNGKWSTLSTPFDSYHDAVLCGQDIAPQNFTVLCPMSRVPTREEQLLLPALRPVFRGRAARKTKVDRWLDSI